MHDFFYYTIYCDFEQPFYKRTCDLCKQKTARFVIKNKTGGRHADECRGRKKTDPGGIRFLRILSRSGGDKAGEIVAYIGKEHKDDAQRDDRGKEDKQNEIAFDHCLDADDRNQQ